MLLKFSISLLILLLLFVLCFQERWHYKLYLVWGPIAINWFRFCLSEFIYLFTFIYKGCISWGQNSTFSVVFVQHLRDAIYLCPGFHYFCCRIRHNCYTLESNVSFFSLEVFKMCLGVVFLVFILFGFCSKSWFCVLMSFIRLELPQPVFLQILLCPIFSSPSVTMIHKNLFI